MDDFIAISEHLKLPNYNSQTLSSKEKEDILGSLIQGRIQVIIATSGLDTSLNILNVGVVINYGAHLLI
ncbi:hypothetical protein FQN53_000002 [Emmonsiellopsis sp. PD_33]|nr:hypothetical protein FQN53_000002 [Emmonsiellopsis sp. PD_33]